MLGLKREAISLPDVVAGQVVGEADGGLAHFLEAGEVASGIGLGIDHDENILDAALWELPVEPAELFSDRLGSSIVHYLEGFCATEDASFQSAAVEIFPDSTRGML